MERRASPREPVSLDCVLSRARGNPVTGRTIDLSAGGMRITTARPLMIDETLRFEVTEEPLGAGYCHCTRCQRRTGTAASVQARLRPGSFRLLAGEELVREYAPEDGWPKCFCSVCGSALWSLNPETGEVGSVRLGLFDPGHGIRPQWRTFVDYACEWEPIPDDGLELYAEGKPR